MYFGLSLYAYSYLQRNTKKIKNSSMKPYKVGRLKIFLFSLAFSKSMTMNRLKKLHKPMNNIKIGLWHLEGAYINQMPVGA